MAQLKPTHTLLAALSIVILVSVVGWAMQRRQSASVPFVTEFFSLAGSRETPAKAQRNHVRQMDEAVSLDHKYLAHIESASMRLYVVFKDHWRKYPIDVTNVVLPDEEAARARTHEMMSGVGYAREDYSIDSIRLHDSETVNRDNPVGLPPEGRSYDVRVVTKRELGQLAGAARRVIYMSFEIHSGELFFWSGPPRYLFGPWKVTLDESSARQRAIESFPDVELPTDVTATLSWRHDGDFEREDIPWSRPMVAAYTFHFWKDREKQQFYMVNVHAETGAVLMKSDHSQVKFSSPEGA